LSTIQKKKKKIISNSLYDTLAHSICKNPI
jgi:hypothetical protein